MTADVAALRYWLLHPDRAYTPHELAIEAVRRIDQPAPDALRAASIDVERLAAALHNRATWTCREDCPASQWDYCDHEIAALAAAYGAAQPAPDALREAAQAVVDGVNDQIDGDHYGVAEIRSKWAAMRYNPSEPGDVWRLLHAIDADRAALRAALGGDE